MRALARSLTVNPVAGDQQMAVDERVDAIREGFDELTVPQQRVSSGGVGGQFARPSQRLGETGPVDRQLRLRPIEQSDLALLLRTEWDPEATGEFEWFGFRMNKARNLERRWHEDGLIGDESSYLAVVIRDGTCAGLVDWRRVGPFGTYEIGIVLFPEHRGHGIGTEAQRQLVDYLFSTTTAHRLQAGTEVDNFAEQKSLERVGFTREGVSRGVHFRAGQWRDGVLYGMLRGDKRPVSGADP